MPKRISTHVADMELTLEGRLIEVYYRQGVQLDVSGSMEVQLPREELTTGRCAMLVFFQPGTLGDVTVTCIDYFGRTNAHEQLVALAIVTLNDLGASMSDIYYTNNPQTFPTRIFRDQGEAREWIKERLVEEAALPPAERPER
jgi:hypothetical protein